jgi:carboxyvinyl-carboxyphosphonate phosphorylmutase
LKRTSKLKELIKRQEILVVPGATDALSAKLIEAAGFNAVYMTGFGTAASIFGLPDIGLLTMTEMVENAKRIADAVRIPVIADADTGYGNHLNVKRTLEEYEKAGVSGIHIEDQVSPKRCGHMGGNQLIPLEEMVAKIRVASEAREDEDFVLIARTDAISAVGFEESIKRGNAYLEAGADIVFVEAPGTMEQLEKIPNFIQGPVLINVGPRTPNLDFKRFEDMGYSIVIYPSICFTASMSAIRKKLAEFKKKRIVEQWAKEGFSFEEMLDLLALKDYTDLEERLLGKD